MGALVNLPRVVRLLRTIRGLKQAELAKLVGVSRTQITNIEGGRTLGSMDVLVAIAEATNISVTDLVFLSTPPSDAISAERFNVVAGDIVRGFISEVTDDRHA